MRFILIDDNIARLVPELFFLNCLYVRIDTDLKICIRHEAEDVDLLSVGAISIS